MTYGRPRPEGCARDSADASVLSACVAVHRLLSTDAGQLADRLRPVALEESDRLRLAAACVTLALKEVFAPDDRRVIRGWTECIRAERQIRVGVARALERRLIAAADYDRFFRLVRDATRLRTEQLSRLRQRLRREAVT
jgi:hypothetical protein